MSGENSSSPGIVRRARSRSSRRVADSGSSDGSPVVIYRRKTRKRIILPSSDSESEVEIGKRRRKVSRAKPVIVSDSENDLESRDDGAACPICLEGVYGSALQGRPDSCAHTFCFECIKTWTENDSSCVLCRAPITKLKVLLRDKVLEEVPVNPVSLKLDETNIQVDHYLCYTCRSYDPDSSLARCDDCDARYHLECLDPPLEDVPRGPWSCPECASMSSDDESGDDTYEPDESFFWYACNREYAQRSLHVSQSRRRNDRRRAGSASTTRRRGRRPLAVRN